MVQCGCLCGVFCIGIFELHIQGLLAKVDTHMLPAGDHSGLLKFINDNPSHSLISFQLFYEPQVQNTTIFRLPYLT